MKSPWLQATILVIAFIQRLALGSRELPTTRFLEIEEEAFVDYLVSKCKAKLSERDAKDFAHLLGPNFRLYQALAKSKCFDPSKVGGAELIYSLPI